MGCDEECDCDCMRCGVAGIVAGGVRAEETAEMAEEERWM